ncbi:MAG: hypothetical protein LC808_00560 [Actinobacteria bacterium]|nr:hypothetical protein [Actinomycetota bacterium]
MATFGIVEDSAPAKHSVWVAWFQCDPGGTIFVKPTDDAHTTLHPAGEHVTEERR